MYRCTNVYQKDCQVCQFVANKIVLHRFSNLTSHKLSKVVDTLFFLTEYIVEKAI